MIGDYPNARAWSNTLRGCAYGDAWGHTNEFKTYGRLTVDSKYGPNLPERLIITDDTQMTLYLARALRNANHDTPEMLRGFVLDEWSNWYADPLNNRAPGSTCLSAIGKIRNGAAWQDATVLRSDGCGTVMRTAPTAFLNEDLWIPMTAWTAATTHGNPTGIAAALVTAAIIRRSVEGLTGPGGLLEDAIWLTGEEFLLEEGGDWLYPLFSDARNKLLDGMHATWQALQNAFDGLDTMRAKPWDTDPCEFGGQGWRSHECLATALLSIDCQPDDEIMALRRATVTNGDSDSIAAVAGAILGASGANWPTEWFDRLEPTYREWIELADNYELQ